MSAAFVVTGGPPGTIPALLHLNHLGPEEDETVLHRSGPADLPLGSNSGKSLEENDKLPDSVETIYFKNN